MYRSCPPLSLDLPALQLGGESDDLIFDAKLIRWVIVHESQPKVYGLIRRDLHMNEFRRQFKVLIHARQAESDRTSATASGSGMGTH